MNYERHYVQFNDLVFDDYDMISDDSTSVSFKTNSSSYTFTHGSYAPMKEQSGLVEAGRLALTITLSMKKLPCDVRKYYPRFAISELTKAGKIWAVQNNELIWAYAFITIYETPKSGKRDTVEIDVDFTLPEGYWHKANKQETFLVPYDPCEFMDCYGYKDVNPCAFGDCCDCSPPPHESCVCCDCDLEKEMALCYNLDKVQEFYTRCGSGYRIMYDCAAAEKFFGDYYGNEYHGTKICTTSGLLAAQYYSDTDIPTDGIKITIHGTLENPYIEINGNGNTINTSFDGSVVIHSNGAVYVDDGCCENLQSVGAWVIPPGSDYGWKIRPGNNRIVIQAGGCCEGFCAYIEVDSRTL